MDSAPKNRASLAADRCTRRHDHTRYLVPAQAPRADRHSGHRAGWRRLRLLEQLEELLLTSDFGTAVTATLVDNVKQRGERGELKTQADFQRALGEAVVAALMSGRHDPSLICAPSGPSIYLVLGVNGAGKTTFIGKLATRLQREGKKVLVAAGDTFRAGAVDQLRVWAERSGAEFVSAGAGPMRRPWRGRRSTQQWPSA